MPQTRYDPFLGSLPPPDDDPQAVMMNQQAGGAKPQSNPIGDILQRMIQQNLGAAPPPERNLSGWEIFAGLTNPNLLNVVMGRRQDTPEMRQYQAGQKMLPDALQAYGHQQSLEAANTLAQQRASLSQSRMDMYRYLPGQLNYLDPQRGNVSMQIWKDRLTGQITDENRQPIDVGALNAQVHFTNYPGGGGENVQAPTSPLPQVPMMTPQPRTEPLPQGMPGSQSMGGMTPRNLKAPALRPGAHQAPAGVTQDVSRATSFVQALAPVFGAWREAKEAVSNVTGSGPMGTAGQLLADRAAQTQGVRAFLPLAIGHAPAQAAIDYKQKQKIALYNYVKQQTGAQFSVSEMDRYESMFPRIEDTEQTALNSLSNLAQKAVNDINALKTQWHAIQTPGGPMFVKPDYMQEFLMTGGMPQEVQPSDPAEAIYQKYLGKKRGEQRP